MKNVLFIMGDLTDGDVAWLAEAGNVRSMSAKDVLIRQGEPIDHLYMILEGEAAVGIVKLGQIARLGPGELLGEVSFLDARPPTATVTILSSSARVLAIPRAVMERKLAEDDAFGSRFYKAIARFAVHRLRNVTQMRSAGENDNICEEPAPESQAKAHLAAARFQQVIQRLAGSLRG